MLPLDYKGRAHLGCPSGPVRHRRPTPRPAPFPKPSPRRPIPAKPGRRQRGPGPPLSPIWFFPIPRAAIAAHPGGTASSAVKYCGDRSM